MNNAAKRRSSALEELKKAESLLLSLSATEEEVTLAKNKYESTLREEMDLRTIVPGVRIAAPNDPKGDEETRAAAKRFLGWGSAEFGDDPEEEEADFIDNISIGLDEINGNVQKNGVIGGLTSGKNFLLVVVASMLIALLWTLSFDPMVASQIFTTAGGSPPSNMPLTSW